MYVHETWMPHVRQSGERNKFTILLNIFSKDKSEKKSM